MNHILTSILLISLWHVLIEFRVLAVGKKLSKLSRPVKVNNTWKPEWQETFYYIGSAGTVCHKMWEETELDEQIRNFMGIYPTEGEAITAREQIIRELQQK